VEVSSHRLSGFLLCRGFLSQNRVARNLRGAGPVTMLLVAWLMGGCAAGGFGLDDAGIDKTIVTGDIGGAGNVAADMEQISDEMTVRNAVSSADIEVLKGAPIPWANADTGARGAISSLVEERVADKLCRRFVTSRERFDGVALFKGEACMVAPGAWKMKDFSAF
jgi:17 kDa outer membrane surface antigen